MSEETLNRLIAVFGSGLGLLIAGGLGMFRARRMTTNRSVIGGVAAASGGLFTAVFVPWMYALASAAGAVIAFALFSLLRSSVLAKSFAALQAFVRRPAVQSISLVMIGSFVMVGSISYLTIEDETVIDADMAIMSELTWRPETQLATSHAAVTDLGNSIALREPVALRDQAAISAIEKRAVGDMRYQGQLIRLAPPCDSHNCHGWVFTGGKYWLSPDDVERILVDNKYEQVSDPRPGDVVIYRLAGQIAHTAIVRVPAANGRPVLVEGKWGWMGVYLHGIDDSSYGKTYAYYRSPREGHVLIGLGGRSTDVAEKRNQPRVDNLATE